MRAGLAAMAALLLTGTAAAQAPAEKPSWLSSKKPSQAAATFAEPQQFGPCIAALNADDAAHAQALANYRALYFQHATKVEQLSLEAAAERLKALPKTKMTAAACLKLAPPAFDRRFKAAHPWATSYFDSGFDREMFEQVPGAVALIAP